MTTLIPDPRDTGTAHDVITETPTVIDFNAAAEEVTARPQLLDRLPQRWGLIAGAMGGSIALATAATVLTTVIARRRAEPRRLLGVRPFWRFGMRHVQTPRGGSAWLGYVYRTPDLRMRLPIHT